MLFLKNHPIVDRIISFKAGVPRRLENFKARKNRLLCHIPGTQQFRGHYLAQMRRIATAKYNVFNELDALDYGAKRRLRSEIRHHVTRSAEIEVWQKIG